MLRHRGRLVAVVFGLAWAEPDCGFEVPERDPVPAGRLLLDDPILGASTTERARKTLTCRLREAMRHINTVIPELGATSPAP